MTTNHSRTQDIEISLLLEVIPYLKTYPFIRVWIPGCATGEEVYSMAILLEEEGLYDRTKIYATDMNQSILEKAKEGLYPVGLIRDYTCQTRTYLSKKNKNLDSPSLL